jgi:hypothetical protein
MDGNEPGVRKQCPQVHLTRRERKHPARVFDQFFDHYHPAEVRELLSCWLVEVISGEESFAGDGMARRNQFFFFEKLSSLVEAAFLIKCKRARKKGG